MDLRDRLRLDVPVARAGIGGGLAGPELAAAVAAAGGPGTLGLPAHGVGRGDPPTACAAPDHSVAVNLLMPFLRRSHVDVCIESRIDVAVIAFVMDWALQRWLTEHGVSGRTHRG